MADNQGRGWVRGTKCDANACLEVLISEDHVALRRSEQHDEVLTVSHGAFQALVDAAKRGEFDQPEVARS